MIIILMLVLLFGFSLPVSGQELSNGGKVAPDGSISTKPESVRIGDTHADKIWVYAKYDLNKESWVFWFAYFVKNFNYCEKSMAAIHTSDGSHKQMEGPIIDRENEVCLVTLFPPNEFISNILTSSSSYIKFNGKKNYLGDILYRHVSKIAWAARNNR